MGRSRVRRRVASVPALLGWKWRSRGVPAVLAACVLAGVGASSPAGPVSGHTTTRLLAERGSEACHPPRRHLAGRFHQTLTHAGTVRQYTLSVPVSYRGIRPAPLIVNLHGFGGTADGQDALSGLPEAGGARGYLVVSPQGLPLSLPAGSPPGAVGGIPWWNIFGSAPVNFGSGPTGPATGNQLGADDIGFIAQLLDTLEFQLCVDASRVYVTGFSNGAGMSSVLGCYLGDRLAAIAPIAGVNLTGVCPGSAPVSVLAIHGFTDHTVLYGGNGLMGFHLGNPSVPDRMRAWALRDGCEPNPTQASPEPGLTINRWSDCSQDRVVELYTIANWDHAWPHATSPQQPGVIDATRVILDFFATQRLPRPENQPKPEPPEQPEPERSVRKSV